jgi:hypothetical protein
VRRIIPILLAVLLLSGARSLAAQAGSSSPTLPSDTLQANYGPRSTVGPTPELAPSLPSDTLDATTGANQSSSFKDGDGAPTTSGDSAALRDLRTWIQTHPALLTPPPVRAVLVRA